ncbi:hypothetical protein DK847_16635 [Aestuariivirga litoralis]|uniref:HNH domain-containing protein n=2 Tax=Aestuariivirga litoralis TaxID=2650924 RepID=A0A2W2BIX7_9HYPH|nr:hypothetical protein DK847_16635 [Aestuariivirga litoralis]
MNRPERRRSLELDAAWKMRDISKPDDRRRWLSDHLVTQNNECYYCGVDMRQATEGKLIGCRPTIDHVIPRSRAGEDTKENTVAACEACNGAKGSLLPEEFKSTEFLQRRKMTVLTPPDRLSADPSSRFYDAAKLERGIHVFLDEKEYFDVEEYCESEGWIRLPAGKARTRTGRPVTITKRGKVVVRYEDI